MPSSLTLPTEVRIRRSSLQTWITSNQAAIRNTIIQQCPGTIIICLDPRSAARLLVNVNIQPLLALLLLAPWILQTDESAYNDITTSDKEDVERNDANTTLDAIHQLLDCFQNPDGELQGLQRKLQSTKELKAVKIQALGNRTSCWGEEDILEIEIQFLWGTRELAEHMEEMYDISDILHYSKNGYPFYTTSCCVG